MRWFVAAWLLISLFASGCSDTVRVGNLHDASVHSVMPNEDAATSENDGAGDVAAEDAAPQGDAPSTDGGLPIPPGGNCAVQDICFDQLGCEIRHEGTNRECWDCVAGCCVARSKGVAPPRCADTSTACATAACDGHGICAKTPAREGQSCGRLCQELSPFNSQTVEAICASGVCRIKPDAGATAIHCDTHCRGDRADCDKCRASGCVAACEAFPGEVSCL